MPDRRYTVVGLVLLVIVLAYPAWRGMALGTRAAAPALAKARRSPCVMPTAEMRRSHMTLLASWRDLAVRTGVRRVTMADGRTWRVSLSGTCLDCHEKATFCDRCHDYAAVKPECWSCHVAPSAGTAASPDAGGTGVPPVGGRTGVSPVTGGGL